MIKIRRIEKGGEEEQWGGKSNMLFPFLLKLDLKPQKLMPVTPSAQSSQSTVQTPADISGAD